jgi:hypothetical protein
MPLWLRVKPMRSQSGVRFVEVQAHGLGLRLGVRGSIILMYRNRRRGPYRVNRCK